MKASTAGPGHLDTRSAGVFLHPTSLPSDFGIGDFGPDAFRWIELLSAADQRYWQVCPLGPTGYGDSPYQSPSSFAGNTLLISPRALREEGLLADADIASFPSLPAETVDARRVREEKERLFRMANERFTATAAFEAFCEAEAGWLDDYALFMVIKELCGGRPWYEWEDELRLRDKRALAGVAKVQARKVRYHKFLQFVFRAQWDQVKTYAHEHRVGIIGDVPYYVAYDSCDAWAAPEVFELDDQGRRLRLSGVPPDYFSADGQLWGNPVYRWDVIARDDYGWWERRLRRTLDLVDIVRLDHFRGFSAFWAVPAGSETARNGTWVDAPGAEFFSVLKKTLKSLPFIAEDLGLITDDVRALLRATGFPGMSVLQFAFDGEPDNPYLPYNCSPDSVIYTGTHDNNTSAGWYQSLPEDARDRVRLYLGCSDADFLDRFLRLAYSAPSRTCIVPFQDVLGLGGGHRFNTPGTGEGNWAWRFQWEMIEEWMLERVRTYTTVYGRNAAVKQPEM
ncbi:MAG: 4-alpha-glucanotransferase [Chitinivibrionales bacterium]|nr:4-alpha-glucanotransferase [Chitinivibrionales bacterium]MBD3396212.1 4-alpha-glucanotransferase [Chitinivibrionales bacterium]